MYLSTFTAVMYYTTELKAIDPKDGKVKTWAGPRIWADSPEQAREYCQRNGLGFCFILGETNEVSLGEEILWLN